MDKGLLKKKEVLANPSAHQARLDLMPHATFLKNWTGQSRLLVHARARDTPRKHHAVQQPQIIALLLDIAPNRLDLRRISPQLPEGRKKPTNIVHARALGASSGKRNPCHEIRMLRWNFEFEQLSTASIKGRFANPAVRLCGPPRKKRHVQLRRSTWSG